MAAHRRSGKIRYLVGESVAGSSKTPLVVDENEIKGVLMDNGGTAYSFHVNRPGPMNR